MIFDKSNVYREYDYEFEEFVDNASYGDKIECWVKEYLLTDDGIQFFNSVLRRESLDNTLECVTNLVLRKKFDEMKNKEKTKIREIEETIYGLRVRDI